MRGFTTIPAAILLFAATSTQTASSPELAPRWDNTSFVEDGGAVGVAVGVAPASARPDRAYLPIEVGVFNRALAAVTVTAGAFELIDDRGRRYFPVDGRTLHAGYGDIDADRRLARLATRMRSDLDSFVPVDGVLTTSFDRPFRRDAHLPRFGWTAGTLYFPRPLDGSADGPLLLVFRGEGLAEPVTVVFELADRDG